MHFGAWHLAKQLNYFEWNLSFLKLILDGTKYVNERKNTVWRRRVLKNGPVRWYRWPFEREAQTASWRPGMCLWTTLRGRPKHHVNTDSTWSIWKTDRRKNMTIIICILHLIFAYHLVYTNLQMCSRKSHINCLREWNKQTNELTCRRICS